MSLNALNKDAAIFRSERVINELDDWKIVAEQFDSFSDGYHASFRI